MSVNSNKFENIFEDLRPKTQNIKNEKNYGVKTFW